MNSDDLIRDATGVARDLFGDVCQNGRTSTALEFIGCGACAACTRDWSPEARAIVGPALAEVDSLRAENERLLRELLDETYRPEGGEIVMRQLRRVQAERDALRAKIEALAAEWYAERGAPAGQPQSAANLGFAQASRLCADELRALASSAPTDQTSDGPDLGGKLAVDEAQCDCHRGQPSADVYKCRYGGLHRRRASGMWHHPGDQALFPAAAVQPDEAATEETR